MNTQQEKILKEFHALYQKYGIPSEKRLTEWLSTAFQEVAEKTRKEAVEKITALIPFPSGDCPSCNRPTISGLHPIDADEHIAFYKEGLADAIKKLSSKEGEGNE